MKLHSVASGLHGNSTKSGNTAASLGREAILNHTRSVKFRKMATRDHPSCPIDSPVRDCIIKRKQMCRYWRNLVCNTNKYKCQLQTSLHCQPTLPSSPPEPDYS